MTNQLIFKSSCWNCKKASEDPNEQYICPQWPNHWAEWEKQTFSYDYF
ncbi:MAG: hypothetical protein GBAus27B_000606 [Mycoplasmataceae bacterium]|nr:MAG: hypothetical protein GBAus27B_000606 [Mycoplasmataceae bacterium]